MSSRSWPARGDRMTDEQVNALVAKGRAALAAVLDQELDTQEGLARIYAVHGLPAPAAPAAAGPGSGEDSGQIATLETTGTVDVDQQGRIRHLDVTYTLHAAPSTQPERVTIEMTFSDFGDHVPVSTPPAGDVFIP
jgi:hypothetical protein